MREVDPHGAVDYILINAKQFAKAKAERTYIEEYRKSLKAILMQKSAESAISAQERDAYAHPEYRQLLDGLRAAVEAAAGHRAIGEVSPLYLFKYLEWERDAVTYPAAEFLQRVVAVRALCKYGYG